MKNEKIILEQSREDWMPFFKFIEFVELLPENKIFMTFGFGLPHLRKYAIRVPRYFMRLYLTLRPKGDKPL